MQEQSILILAKALRDHGVEAVLVGGMAMVVHGCDTVTQDFDLAFSVAPGNLQNLTAALRSLGASPARWGEAESFVVDEKLLGLPFVALQTTAGSVDLLMKTPPLTFEQLKANSILIEFEVGDDKISIAVASLDDLLLMKEASTREKDALHVIMLKRLQGLRIGSRARE